jgi:hypothetical protein
MKRLLKAARLLLKAVRLLNAARLLNGAPAEVIGIVAVPRTAIAASATIDLRIMFFLLLAS